MAIAFLGVSSGAISAPLNPGYREGEFDFNLSELNAKALIVQSGSASPALTEAYKEYPCHCYFRRGGRHGSIC
jgi:hypothetical protein